MEGVSVAKLAFSKEAPLNSPAIIGAVARPANKEMKAKEAIINFFIFLVPSELGCRFVVPMVRR
jgi:hypothetical protein